MPAKPAPAKLCPSMGPAPTRADATPLGPPPKGELRDRTEAPWMARIMLRKMPGCVRQHSSDSILEATGYATNTIPFCEPSFPEVTRDESVIWATGRMLEQQRGAEQHISRCP